MIKVMTLSRAIRSTAEFENFELLIGKAGYVVAPTALIPAETLQKLSKPRWSKRSQGCIVYFNPLKDMQEIDESTPLGRRIAPSRNSLMLSHFIAGMCGPVCFEEWPLLRGQKIILVDIILAETRLSH